MDMVPHDDRSNNTDPRNDREHVSGDAEADASADVSRLLPQHLQDLRASGLADQTIARARLYSVNDANEARALLRWMPSKPPPNVPALAFPYDDAATHVRLRPDTPRRLKTGHEVKYESPEQVPSEIYVPMNVCPAIDDHSVELYITEGEKKALASCQAGLATVALPGVDLSHDVAARKAAKKAGINDWRLHPRLDHLVHATGTAKRTIVIAFDSDIDKNENIQWAAARLIKMLRAAGATPFMTFLEHGEDGEKIGLDDLYLSLGCDNAAFRATLTAAKRPAAADKLLGWMVAGWSGWDDTRKQRELRRALWIVTRTESSENLRRWCNDVVATLRTTKQNMKSLQAELRSNHDLEMQDELEASDWLQAPGYAVVASGTQPGIWTTKGNQLAERIATAPINVIGVGVDERGQHYCTVRFMHGEQERRRTVPRGVVAGPDVLSLADYGAPITAANRAAMQTFLAAQEQYSLDELPRTRIFTQCGWSDDLQRFVLGRRVIGGDGISLVGADDEFLDALQPGGDERAQMELMLKARKLSFFGELADAAGAAAPLERLLQVRSLLVSIFGHSLGGKSASQALAVSHFGRPEKIKITGDTTATALEAALKRNRDLPLFIDDTQATKDGGLLDTIAYQVGGGVGKSRGTTTGGMQPIANWLSLALVSGEKPLMKVGVATGARNRTIEIKFESFPDKSFPQELHRDLDRHYGHTGPKLIQALIECVTRPGRLELLRALYRGIGHAISPTRSEKIDQVALLATGNVMSRVLVHQQDPRSALLGAVTFGTTLLRKLDGEVDAGVDRIEAGMEAIRAFVAENAANFDVNNAGNGRCFGVWVRDNQVDGRRVVAILRAPLEEHFKRSSNKLSVDEVMHGLRERGRLILGEKKGDSHRLQRKTPTLGTNARAYWVDIGDDETEPAASQGIGDVDAQPAHPRGIEECLELLEVPPYWDPDDLPRDLVALVDALFSPLEEAGTAGGRVETRTFVPVPSFELIERRDDVARARDLLARRGVISLSLDARARYLSVAAADAVAIFDLERVEPSATPLRELLQSPQPKVVHNLDRVTRKLVVTTGIELKHVEDLYAASVLSDGYVRERGAEEHGLDVLVERHLRSGLPRGDAEGLAGLARRASALLQLRTPLRAAVTEAAVERAWKLENEIVAVVARIEATGFYLDIDRTKTVAKRAHEAADAARARLAEILGEVNLDNHDDLCAALGRRCGFAFTTTSAFHLTRLARLDSQHSFLIDVLRYRKAAMYAQNAERWLDAVGADGRLRATYESLAAATGRMSCSDPPLQSVPTRLRDCFVAAPGCKLVIADYSAIELAIIANRVNDVEMRRCLHQGIDLHRRTAAYLLNKSIGVISDDERRLVKPVAFGVVYGMGVETLIEYAEENYGVHFTQQDAQRARTGFFQLYKGVAEWHKQARREVPQTTEIRSESGRLRRVTEPKLTELLNTPVQGTGADGFKRAIALVHPAVQRLGGRLVHLQHDEIVAEVPEDAATTAAMVIQQLMVDGMTEFVTHVPVRVKTEIAGTWAKP